MRAGRFVFALLLLVVAACATVQRTLSVHEFLERYRSEDDQVVRVEGPVFRRIDRDTFLLGDSTESIAVVDRAAGPDDVPASKPPGIVVVSGRAMLLRVGSQTWRGVVANDVEALSSAAARS